jgi:hypothetical protein
MIESDWTDIAIEHLGSRPDATVILRADTCRLADRRRRELRRVVLATIRASSARMSSDIRITCRDGSHSDLRGYGDRMKVIDL